MQFKLALLTALAVPFAANAALFPAGSHVKQATASTFKNMLADAEVAIVLMTAPWCGHCKNLVPAAHEAAASLAPLGLPIINIDCDAEMNKPLCGQYDVKGFPTIKVFSKGKKAPVDYTGERSAAAMADHAIGRVKSHAKRIGSVSEFSDWVDEKTEKGHIMLLTAKPATPALYKVFAAKFNPRVASGAARLKPETAELAQLLGVESNTKTATLFYIPPGKNQDSKVVYDGEMKLAAMSAWLKEQIGEPKEEPKPEKKAAKPKAKAADKTKAEKAIKNSKSTASKESASASAKEEL